MVALVPVERKAGGSGGEQRSETREAVSWNWEMGTESARRTEIGCQRSVVGSWKSAPEANTKTPKILPAQFSVPFSAIGFAPSSLAFIRHSGLGRCPKLEMTTRQLALHPTLRLPTSPPCSQFHRKIRAASGARNGGCRSIAMEKSHRAIFGAEPHLIRSGLEIELLLFPPSPTGYWLVTRPRHRFSGRFRRRSDPSPA